MERTSHLGELEHMVLLAVLRLGDDAYGRSIREELESRVGRRVSRSVAYVTLERMADKGYLTPRMGEPSPRRGGKAKRFYALTPAGKEALRESGRALRELWAGHEHLLEDA
ncbi:MAG: helix-turn-helix transcriptional regulator [Gemmatimonadota bacterium]|jgi:DNA-binding PadR family transcriptional regulator